MSRGPWFPLGVITLAALAWLTYDTWDTWNQHELFHQSRHSIELRLDQYLNAGYTSPAEELLSKFDKVQELEPFRRQLAIVRKERLLRWHREIQMDLYIEIGQSMIDMAEEELISGDFNAAKNAIRLFDKLEGIPELEDIRRRIAVVESEVSRIDNSTDF